MKIALVNNQHQLGGAETVVGQLHAGIAAAGHQVDLHVARGKTYPPGVKPLYPGLLSRVHHSRFGGIVEKIAPRFEWTDAAFRRLAEIDADIIHLHNFHGDYATIESLAHVAARKKLVWTFHALWGVTGGCDHPRDCRGYLDRCGNCPQVGWWPVGPVDHTAAQLEKKTALLSRAPLHVVAPSQWLADIVRNSRVGGNWPVHQITNGVDPAQFAPPGARPRGEPVILIVNRNFSDEQKGFPIALKALAMAGRTRAKIILAGENSAWAAAQLPPHFTTVDAGFVSGREKLAALYAQADIFLFASPAENFPCVVIEAMSSGCCVVATPSGGVVEQIVHGRSGLLAGAIDGESLGVVLCKARSRMPHCARVSAPRRAGAGGRAFFRADAWSMRTLRFTGKWWSMKISAYLPAFNSRRTIGDAIASIRAQSHPVDEIFVIDNHSADGSAQFVASLGVRVVPQPHEWGAAPRARSRWSEAAHELVLCCDSGITLDPDFVKNALPWFDGCERRRRFRLGRATASDRYGGALERPAPFQGRTGGNPARRETCHGGRLVTRIGGGGSGRFPRGIADGGGCGPRRPAAGRRLRCRL